MGFKIGCIYQLVLEHHNIKNELLPNDLLIRDEIKKSTAFPYIVDEKKTNA